MLPSAHIDCVGVLITSFRSSIPSPPIPLFTLRCTPHDAQRKTRGRVVRYSFLVRILHSLLHAGLSRRTDMACLQHLSERDGLTFRQEFVRDAGGRSLFVISSGGPEFTTLRALRGLPSVTEQTSTEIAFWITRPGLRAYTVGETLRHSSTCARRDVSRPDAATTLCKPEELGYQQVFRVVS